MSCSLVMALPLYFATSFCEGCAHDPPPMISPNWIDFSHISYLQAMKFWSHCPYSQKHHLTILPPRNITWQFYPPETSPESCGGFREPISDINELYSSYYLLYVWPCLSIWRPHSVRGESKLTLLNQPCIGRSISRVSEPGTGLQPSLLGSEGSPQS